jgi:hypothetical protein
MNGLNGYVCFYKGKRLEVFAETIYKAECEAAKQLGVKPKNQYQISVNLCERADGTEVIHSAD